MEETPKYSRKEELSHALSHFTGALLAIAGLLLMLRHSIHRGTGWHVMTTSVFGVSMIVLYLTSALTHILPTGKTKNLFFNLDRIAIYLLIAGTYTPIALLALRGPLGWIIFGIEWGLALLGTWMVLRNPGRFNRGVSLFYVISYAVMGWLILIAIVPLMNRLPLMGTIWILIGGTSYSIGILFYKFISFPYHHLVWHLLVLAGTFSHFMAVFFYVIPR